MSPRVSLAGERDSEPTLKQEASRRDFYPAKTPPARTRSALIAILHQNSGESMGSSMVSVVCSRSARAAWMNMGSTEQHRVQSRPYNRFQRGNLNQASSDARFHMGNSSLLAAYYLRNLVNAPLCCFQSHCVRAPLQAASCKTLEPCEGSFRCDVCTSKTPFDIRRGGWREKATSG